MGPTLPRLLTLAEVAVWLFVSETQLRRWAKQGLIPCRILPGGEFVFELGELAAWAEALPSNRQEQQPCSA